jgi:hypothetical protein
MDTGINDAPDIRNPSRPKSTHVKRKATRYRLLAGGARIHVDFHANRHFDDLRGFPGHLALLVNGTNSALTIT